MNIEYYISKLIKKIHLKAILNSNIDKTAHIAAGCHIVDSTIGKYSDVGYDCQIIDTEIGSFCSFASNIIIGGKEHTMDWVSTSQVFNENPDSMKKKFSKHKYASEVKTTIGNDVWIGNNVLIKSGIRIGDGVIIGMGSVVTKDIPNYEIWAGNPAHMIRKRFDDQIISKLNRIKWWNFTEENLYKYAGYFNNVEGLLEFLDKENALKD